MRLLVIEDDIQLSQNLKKSLDKVGFAVDTTDNGIDGEYLGNTISYDAIILDLGLTDKNGLEILRNWRGKQNKTPVIILTARNAWYEKVDGFKAGADDYLGKPFYNEELIARINALIRRNNQLIGSELNYKNITLDQERQILNVGNSTYELTDIEFRLIRYFMIHPGIVISKSQIDEHIYNLDSENESNVIEVYINRMRQKIGKEMIKTKRRQGYVFGD